MRIHILIDDAHTAIADNPYNIDATRLSMALDRLLGRREALDQMQLRIQTVAEGLAEALATPSHEVPGLAFADDHFSKVTLAGLLANFRTSVREVERELEGFKRAKAEHVTLLNEWSRHGRAAA